MVLVVGCGFFVVGFFFGCFFFLSFQRIGVVIFILQKLQLQYCAQFWTSPHKKDIEALQPGQRMTMELGKGLKHTSNEEQLRLFSLEERRLRGL